MKFLLDVCSSSRSLTAFLIEQGHDVASALSLNPQASDGELLTLAHRERRVLITEDKDFGELVVVLGRPHHAVVRLVALAVDDQIAAMREVLEAYGHELEAKSLIVVTRGRIRVRKTEHI